MPCGSSRKALPGCPWREGIYKGEFLEMVKEADREMIGKEVCGSQA